MYIGGAGLSRGYLNHPSLTAEYFIQDPFNSKPDARLYKSGDLGRYLPDGNLEYLGRRDSQVKIRGYRIELGEIEAVLNQHPAVRESVVVIQDAEHITESKRLVAYVVPKQEQAITKGQLQHFLKGKLPGYMLPSDFVLLKSLPLTLSGKLDRLALPVSEQLRPNSEGTYVPCRTPVEKVLAHIWTEILGHEQFGVYDNFFEVGGDSLFAFQVVLEVHSIFRVDPPLENFFKVPTIADMAHIIVACETEAGQTEQIARTRLEQYTATPGDV